MNSYVEVRFTTINICRMICGKTLRFLWDNFGNGLSCDENQTYKKLHIGILTTHMKEKLTLLR